VQNKLDRIKAPLAQVAANTQLAVLCYGFLLNAAVCRSLVETIGYRARYADYTFGRQMPPNAAKYCKNASKFFPNVSPLLYYLLPLALTLLLYN